MAAASPYLSPCSNFTKDIWESTTGESLSDQLALISSPSRFKNSTEEANRRDSANPADSKAVSAPSPLPVATNLHRVLFEPSNNIIFNLSN
jgi:hypothetical protein